MEDPSVDVTHSDIAVLLERPELASVRNLATHLRDEIIKDLPDPSMLDPLQLLTMCATVVVLSEQEGSRKYAPLVETNNRLISALESRIKQLEVSVEVLEDRWLALRDVAEEQELLIIAQEKALDAAVEGAGFRELRLPH